MSVHLWSYYLQDDIDSFQQLLAEAGVSGRTNALRSASATQNLSFGNSVGSPNHWASLSSAGALRGLFHDQAAEQQVSSSPGTFRDITLNKSDVNRKDGKGMTILHYAASSTTENALGFAQALLAHPHIDLFAQDLENGWTALHRAFYAGNISIARAIIERESQLALGQASGSTSANAPNLMKIKDKEGHGPYDLYAATIHDRTLQILQSRASVDSAADDADEERLSVADADEGGPRLRATIAPIVDLQGDELFTFGSNRNVTLGFGDEDDRQRPERVKITRPAHLFKRFYREHFNQRADTVVGDSPASAEKLQAQARMSKDLTDLPSIIRSTPMSIQDVQMAKFHTAILTNDPISNLYVCGHGLGGRLGTGSEKTEFNLVCLEDFGSERKKIVAVALGQDHTLAVTDGGELFAWGSNFYGQLGSGLPKAKTKPEEAIQLLPKQLFGTLKREFIQGVAASAYHSVAHTSNALFTWGKNVGQLGLVDSGARSLEAQGTPRNVTPARFSKPIMSVSAIDRATICLLESHEVFVFANYGCVRLDIPVGQFSNYFLDSSFRTSYAESNGPRRIVKVTSGGDTICALSSAGEVYTVTVKQAVPDPSSTTTSTTNPNKIKASISPPVCAWSLKKDAMAARDVGVDQDGSVVISTQAGSVWRRVARPKTASKMTEHNKSKDFKFSRVPNLTRVIAVRSSTSGAYCAIRQECNVTREQIMVNQKSLWNDFFDLLPFSRLCERSMEDAENPPLLYRRNPTEAEKLVCFLSSSKDLEQDISSAVSRSASVEGCDLVFSTSVSDVKIPVHSFIVGGRSSLLRSALSAYRHEGSIENDSFEITTDTNGYLEVRFSGIDFLTLVELVLFMYTDQFVGFWQYSRTRAQMAYRYNSVRSELMKLASRLELRNLESAARRMAHSTERSLPYDVDLALSDSSFLENGDALLQLADGEVLVHSMLLAKRCPFFEGLFFGRAAGGWLAQRRENGPSNVTEIDLKHIEVSTFKIVLRYLYTDAGAELFDDIVTEDLDEFLDAVMDVLSVANELMLDRLSQVCQQVLGRYVTTRNVCQLLNAIAPCSITEFKDAALEYLCLNLEALLANQWLDELDDDLLLELDARVRGNQLDFLPFARSGRSDEELFERHPDLAATIVRARQAKLDALKLQTKFDSVIPLGSSFELLNEDIIIPTPTKSRRRSRHSRGSSAATTPLLKARAKALQLEVEDELAGSLPSALLSGSAIEADTSTPRPSSSAVTSPVLGPQDGTPVSPRLGPTAMTPPKIGTILELPLRSESNQVAPWASSALPTAKLSMKEIMTQASSSSTSSLSSGLRAQAKDAASSSSSFSDKAPQKMSQKERKKMQKQHSEAVVESGKEAGTPKSAWKTVPSYSKPAEPSISANNAAATTAIGPRPGQQQMRTQPTPHLTMRQTVANTPPKTPLTPASLAEKPNMSPTPPPQRGKQTSPGGASKAIPIQSIRHSASPMRESSASPTTFMHQSLADIISQEQAGKDALKEAVAKRSLQEIQQEQAFQEWWDAESRAVQEAEAAAKAAGGRGEGASRGRGGKARGGSGPGQRRKRGGKVTATSSS